MSDIDRMHNKVKKINLKNVIAIAKTKWSIICTTPIIIYNPVHNILELLKVFVEIPFFLKLGFTPCKAEQPLQDMELQEKETQKD